MPWDEVMHKWKAGKLHSGSASGPKVKSQKQAVAIMLSEKRAAAEGKKEYQAHAKGGAVKYQDGGTVDLEARAPPFSEHAPSKMFPQVPSTPATRKLSPDVFPSKQKAHTIDYPSHTVEARKGGPISKPGWRRW